MAELKAMLYGTPKPAPVEEMQDAPEEVLAVEPEAPAVPEGPAIPMVFAEDQSVKQAKSAPEAAPEVEPEPETAFQFFGKGADEYEPQAPTRTEAPSKDDSMSLPLMGLEEDEAPARPAAPAEEAPAQPAEEAAPAAPEAEEKPEEEAEPETPEQVGEKLRRMGAELTLRCVLEGILAVVLLHFGLVAEGLLAPVASLDPVIAPAAFYAANLLFLAGALAVGWPVLRDGLQGLKDRPSADTMPALAACGALVQAAVALLNAQSYQNSSWTLLSGVAALGLFLALLGSRVLLTAVRNSCFEELRHQEVVRTHQNYVMGSSNLIDYNTEHYLLYSDLNDHLQEAIKKLPEDMRTIFEMNRFKNLKYREIAEELNVSVRTVESKISKSLEFLRNHLSGFYDLILLFIINLMR